VNLARLLAGEEPVLPPTTTMLGALYRYLREADPRHFQPMNANFGLVDELGERVRDKRAKKERLADRALAAMTDWRDAHLLAASGPS
jgi:methylenetetrahydrofolate--tRNA-(uracil-5-)-methyltransferase